MLAFCTQASHESTPTFLVMCVPSWAQYNTPAMRSMWQVTVPGGMVGDVLTPMPAAEVAAMKAGMDFAFAAAAAAGADNGAAIVDPRDGQARRVHSARCEGRTVFCQFMLCGAAGSAVHTCVTSL